METYHEQRTSFFDNDFVYWLGAILAINLDWVDPISKLLIALVAVVGLIFKIVDYLKKWKREDNNFSNSKSKEIED